MRRRWFLAVALASLAVVSAPDAPAITGPSSNTSLREVFSPDGSITRVRVPEPAPPPADELAAVREAVAGVTPVDHRGPIDARLDLVFVGDGYTRAELATFHRDVRRHVGLLFSIEPYRNYRELFNVWAVDVVSPESGVDNDPTPGVMRATALDMEFWCSATERLLCVDTAKATAAARAAPEADQIVAIANSSKYGGAGGPVAAASGANALSAQILMHELGHSIGDLADEYDSPYFPYVGVEPEEPNVTVYPAETMMSERRKWYRWVGQSSPDGAVVGSYRGARYNPVIYWRPTPDSLMRSLGREFNSPSREAMVLAFYRFAKPIAAARPAPGRVRGDARLAVDVVRPRAHGIRVTWLVDGVVVARRASTLDLRRLRLRPGGHRVQVVVEDPTPWVLPSTTRTERLVQIAGWTTS